MILLSVIKKFLTAQSFVRIAERSSLIRQRQTRFEQKKQ